MHARGCVPPRPAVDLLLAVPRPKVMRRLWAQIAALGVGQIILTNAGKVERNYFDTHILSREDLPAPADRGAAAGARHAAAGRIDSPSVQDPDRGRVWTLFPPGFASSRIPPPRRRSATPLRANTRTADAARGRTGRRVECLRTRRCSQRTDSRPAGMGPRTLRTDTGVRRAARACDFRLSRQISTDHQIAEI